MGKYVRKMVCDNCGKKVKYRYIENDGVCSRCGNTSNSLISAFIPCKTIIVYEKNVFEIIWDWINKLIKM